VSRRSEAPQAAKRRGGPLRIILFQSATCSGCRRTQEAVEEAKGRFGDRIEVLWENFDDDPGAFRRLFLFEDHYGVGADEQPPTLFVGDAYISGIDAIQKTLHDVIAAELQAGHATYVLPAAGGESGETAAKADEGLLKRFDWFSAGAAFVRSVSDWRFCPELRQPPPERPLNITPASLLIPRAATRHESRRGCSSGSSGQVYG